MQHVEIRVKGLIDENWSEWFEGLTITHSDEGETILSGNVIDQAALYGLLAKLRDLGLSLQSVNSALKEPQGEKKHPPAEPSDQSQSARPAKLR
ncbi:MAG: hypothetical protein HYZ35_08215 [Chloroflexi bacterium]|nr:hypothetical protein [Chloroflexota bacterium]